MYIELKSPKQDMQQNTKYQTYSQKHCNPNTIILNPVFSTLEAM